MTPQRVHETIEISRASADFTIDEEPGQIRLGGLFSRACLTAWQELADNLEPWLSLTCIDDTADEIAPRDGIEGRRHRITLHFLCPADTPHIFTKEGWHILLHNDDALASIAGVRLAFTGERFATRAFRVEPWIGAPTRLTPTEHSEPTSAGPRRHVRCQSSGWMAPTHIEPWISLDALNATDLAIALWRDRAAERIAASLPNEIYQDNGTRRVLLAGQPPRRMDFGAIANEDSLFSSLQDAASWVYLEGEDIEVRHTFLSAELARQWRPDVAFCQGLESHLHSAIESARLLYKAHLRSSSKDTLKALADLRKTLAEEVQKLLQQSRDLSASIWRDAALAIGTVAVRLAIDSAKTPSVSAGFAVIFAIVAIYVAVSYGITVKTNQQFINITNNVREIWRNKLYAFLDDNDYHELADRPLIDAADAYRKTRTRTTAVVIVVVLGLMFGTCFEMGWVNPTSWINLAKTYGTIVWQWVHT